MKLYKRQIYGVWKRLPAVYNVQPEGDYQALISHSADELMWKAWEYTGQQMKNAIQQVEKRNPDVKQRIAQIYGR